MQEGVLTLWATVAAAVAGYLSAWVAYYAIKKQAEQAKRSQKDFKFSLAADLSLKLEDKFNAQEFRHIRSSAATALLKKDNWEDAEDVFDFFETVGLLTRTGALTKELAHNFFFHWINLYWNAGKYHIAEKRQDARLLWEDFESVYTEVLKVEMRKDPNSKDLNPSEERLKNQLKEEIEDGHG